MIVVLPQPFEPKKPKISPACISKLTSFTTVKSPKSQVKFLAIIAGDALLFLKGGDNQFTMVSPFFLR